MRNDAMLVLRLPSNVKVALAEASKDHVRSMSGMTTWIVTAWLRKQKYLSAAAARRAGPRRPARAKRS